MGECNYYLKARFQSAKAAGAAEHRLRSLFAEGAAAYAHWQDSRKWGQPRPSATEFWVQFRKQFPIVYGYLRELADTQEWDNGLAGHLSCFTSEAPPTHKGKLLCLKLNLIWHCAELGLLERFCLDELGAVAVGSLSEYDHAAGENAPDEEYFEVIDV